MIVNVGAAVNVIHGIRTHHAQTTGCPTWDAAGIRAALIATEGQPGDVLAAAALAASDPGLRLPSPNGFRAHWPKNATAEPRQRYTQPCPEHPEHDMPHDHGSNMTPEQIAAAARAARAGIAHVKPAPRRTPPPTDLAALRARADQENQP